MKRLFTIGMIWLAGLCQAQTGGSSRIAFLNGIAHIGNGQVIENSLIVIKGDRIEQVSDSRGIKLDFKAFDTVVDLSGKHVYPAFINCNNILGLHDAEAVRATVDWREVGTLNPHVRAQIAFNTDNIIIPTVRANGVLYTQVTPRSGLISGSSSVMSLSGWNWEDATILADDGIHLNFPREPVHNPRVQEGDEQKAVVHYQKEVQQLHEFFADAWSYARIAEPKEKDTRLEAMKAMMLGKASLYLHADRAGDILAGIRFAQKYAVPRIVLVGGKQAYRVLAELKANNIPVMLGRIHDLPDHTDDDHDLVFRLPAMLQKDSVFFCLQLEGDMEAMQSRNLMFNAGTAVAYGLSREQAIASISLHPAKILGIDSMLGSLEEGKLASFTVCSGDILDMRSSNILMIFMAGKRLELNNRQTDLYEKYKTKYGFR